MSQTERILYIDRNLRTDRYLTVQDVADYFEVSTRQVKRDIEYLRDRFNAPIVFDRIKKFIVMKPSLIDWLLLIKILLCFTLC